MASGKKPERPDFRQVGKLIEGLQETIAFIDDMPRQLQQLKESALEKCGMLQKEQAAGQLTAISVEELKKSRAGIRTNLLQEAGYHTLYDLYAASDLSLHAVRGVGEKQTAAIRMIIDEFLVQLSGRGAGLKLSADRSSAKNRELIPALARYRQARLICRDSSAVCQSVKEELTQKLERVRIRSRFHWLFSRRETKEETLQALRELQVYSQHTDYLRADRLIRLFFEAVKMNEDQAFSDFTQNGAAYYALLEDLTGSQPPQELIYGSIPAQMAAKISSVELDLDGFRGDLRGYQRFGVQYILHQKKVLLGDEMGLGKTIQAIAAMVHLNVVMPGSRFLVVAPASVMVNWCREIEKFSQIHAVLLHGSFLSDGLEKWAAGGGVAVTNYESLRHITGRIDGKLKLSMLVIDEAHYIKNPEAQRTRYIHRLEDEAEHILMMTGTPLENRVDEMCELIGFLRQDMVSKIRAYAGMHQVAAFREMLSPVYLRRQADQVLEELPELTEKEEWCSMTGGDLAAYVAQVESGNFMAMRRVSFLQENMASSAKAERLMELCAQAADEGKKVIIYSYFRETLKKVSALLSAETYPEAGAAPGPGEAAMAAAPEGGLHLAGEITGSTPVLERQGIIDRFSQFSGSCILLCQVQSGGTGLNIQAASVVIFCEPQIKPSLERQAIARVYRMGQIRNVLVYHLLCAHTADEAVRTLLEEKSAEFAAYADESVMADAEAALADQEWIRAVVEEERRRYLPAVFEEKKQ